MRSFRSLGLVGALAATLGMGGCASTQTWPMYTATTVPAAQGQVQVATEKDGNNRVKVEVQHLAPPQNVALGASTYVVWLKPAYGAPQNVGVLRIGGELKGKLETKTPYRAFEITVTAESNPSATIPSNSPVLRTSVAVPG